MEYAGRRDMSVCIYYRRGGFCIFKFPCLQQGLNSKNQPVCIKAGRLPDSIMMTTEGIKNSTLPR